MAKTIEKKVADTMLQKPVEITAGGAVYVVPTPTLATLLHVSEKISELPEDIGSDSSAGRIFCDLKQCRKIAEICSIYILGEKRISQDNPSGIRAFLKLNHIKHPSVLDKMTQKILSEWTPTDLMVVFKSLLDQSNLNDFFVVTTFLGETNVIRPTKVEKKETTAAGQ